MSAPKPPTSAYIVRNSSPDTNHALTRARTNVNTHTYLRILLMKSDGNIQEI